jgi:hypothetical protein
MRSAGGAGAMRIWGNSERADAGYAPGQGRACPRSAKPSTSASTSSQHRHPARQGRPRIGQRVSGRPARAGEQAGRLAVRMFQPDQPEAAIRGRAQHGVAIPQRMEGRHDVMRPQAGDIGADQRRAARPQGAQHLCHALRPNRPRPGAAGAAAGQSRAANPSASGVTASQLCQRGSPDRRRISRTVWWRIHQAASTVPMSRASRVLTRPGRGSFAMTTDVRAQLRQTSPAIKRR